MSAHADRAWDIVPIGVAAAAGATAIGYVQLMGSQGDSPRAWFLGGLISASALAAYAVPRFAPRRVEALAVSGGVLVSLGMLALFSIGLPILIAGGLAVAFASKAREQRTSR